MTCISFLPLQLILRRDAASLLQLRHHRKSIPQYLPQHRRSRQSCGCPIPLKYSNTITCLQYASLPTHTTLNAGQRHTKHKPELMRTLRIPASTQKRHTNNLLATIKSLLLPQNPQPHHLTAVLLPSSTPSTPNQRLHSHSEQHAASPRNTARVPRPPPTQLGGVGEHRPRESDGTDHLDHASAAYDVIRGCEDTSSPKRRRVPGTSGGRNRGANCLVVDERDGGDGWDYATHSF
jgi:hypothetical protein